jgi:hypothetical protein
MSNEDGGKIGNSTEPARPLTKITLSSSCTLSQAAGTSTRRRPFPRPFNDDSQVAATAWFNNANGFPTSPVNASSPTSLASSRNVQPAADGRLDGCFHDHHRVQFEWSPSHPAVIRVKIDSAECLTG